MQLDSKEGIRGIIHLVQRFLNHEVGLVGSVNSRVHLDYAWIQG